MEFERLEFVEAIEELASYLGLDVPREQRSGGSGQFKSGIKQATVKNAVFTIWWAALLSSM